MVAHLLALLLFLSLGVGSAGAASSRPLCLRCHTPHYADRGSCTACHRGNPATDRRSLAHDGLIGRRYAAYALEGSPQLREGERLVEQYACRRCHRVAGRGNRLAADLDRSAALRSPEALVTALLHPALAMPDFRLGRERADLLAVALLAGARRAPQHRGEQRQTVHFDRAGAAGRDVFSVKCGSCHQVLTRRHGALGSGAIGPNLSGLLSPFYPRTFRNGEAWQEERLREWLRNPRAIRPAARMQPVDLSEKEFRELAGILEVE